MFENTYFVMSQGKKVLDIPIEVVRNSRGDINKLCDYVRCVFDIFDMHYQHITIHRGMVTIALAYIN